MVSLSLFIGQLLADIANARTNADYVAAGVSEQYHADPFVKNLPIPHYIIDEAEIDVPVMVVGVSTQSDQFAKQKQAIVESIERNLPILIIRCYKFNFMRDREKSDQQQETKMLTDKKIKSETTLVDSTSKPIKKDSVIKNKFSEVFLKNVTKSSKDITTKIVGFMNEYLDNYNYEIIKLLDFTEDFIKQLNKEMSADMYNYAGDILPYVNEESIYASATYMGNIMFFDFKKIMKSDAGVNIDVKTVQMNEYATKNCLMHIKLKIKEQDLNLIVEEGTKGKEKRYLSLT